jgi:hypothetical protein
MRPYAWCRLLTLVLMLAVLAAVGWIVTGLI